MSIEKCAQVAFRLLSSKDCYFAYLKGKEITVSVFVNTEGEVDSVAIYPDIKDSFYKREIIRRAYGWRFEPAKRAGKAVAVWWSYKWKL